MNRWKVVHVPGGEPFMKRASDGPWCLFSDLADKPGEHSRLLADLATLVKQGALNAVDLHTIRAALGTATPGEARPFDADKFMAWLRELAEAVGPALIVNSPAGGLLRLAATDKLAVFYEKHCAHAVDLRREGQPHE